MGAQGLPMGGCQVESPQRVASGWGVVYRLVWFAVWEGVGTALGMGPVGPPPWLSTVGGVGRKAVDTVTQSALTQDRKISGLNE